MGRCLLLLCVLLPFCQLSAEEPLATRTRIRVSASEGKLIGEQIWKNECAGTVAGLLGWNAGESFASLGIGHFIWYAKGKDARYEESFPALVRFLQTKKATLPKWLLTTPDCPWTSKTAFERAKSKDPRLKELQKMLLRTIPLQTEFILRRLEASLDKMENAAPNVADAHRLKKRFYALATTANGKYALMDYVNFKGDGTNAKERFKGEGWGLMQVLLAMEGKPTVTSFAKAAEKQLTRRTINNPPDKRWLKGWINRVSKYPTALSGKR